MLFKAFETKNQCNQLNEMLFKDFETKKPNANSR